MDVRSWKGDETARFSQDSLASSISTGGWERKLLAADRLKPVKVVIGEGWVIYDSKGHSILF